MAAVTKLINFEIGPLFPEPALDDTETEFSLYARDRKFADLKFARIMVAGKEHVCASYVIDDWLGRRWNKKYMIVFGGTEYAITATCNDPRWFINREKDWDAIIQSFRPLIPVDDSAHAADRASARYRDQRREIIEQRIQMREMTGPLYARAYESVALGNFSEARILLEECLAEDPDHVLAHKELAVVLEKLGNIHGALRQREEVKRLAPSDVVNRRKLAWLLAGCGARGAALRGVRECVVEQPNDPIAQELEAKLAGFRYTDYRLLFLASLVSLLLLDIGLLTNTLGIKDVWCMRLSMLIPVGGMYAGGPWVGLSRTLSVVLAGTLYLFFLLHS